MARLESKRVIRYTERKRIRRARMMKTAVAAVVALVAVGGVYASLSLRQDTEVSAKEEQIEGIEIALLEQEESGRAEADEIVKNEVSTESDAGAQSEAADATRPAESTTGGSENIAAENGAASGGTASNSTASSGTAGNSAAGNGTTGNSTTATSKAPDQKEKPEVLVKSDADRTKQRDAYLVVLDPGHGGNDVGANTETIYEKDINLKIATQVATLLQEEGVLVVMTRDSDKYRSLEQRVEVSNTEEPDLFVSLHCNTYPADTSVGGLDCFYAEKRKDGAFYAEYIMKNVKASGEIRCRGVKEEDFFVTQYNHWPAVLVEMGFMTNPKELEKLTSADYQTLMATELAEGILEGLRANGSHN